MPPGATCCNPVPNCCLTANNFAIQGDASYDSSGIYDVNSIMHYIAGAFANTGTVTLTSATRTMSCLSIRHRTRHRQTSTASANSMRTGAQRHSSVTILAVQRIATSTRPATARDAPLILRLLVAIREKTMRFARLRESCARTTDVISCAESSEDICCDSKWNIAGGATVDYSKGTKD